jgi:cellulose synthase/poly-beta-1,6-N-acetylglucosamine synthase-like glycosyltransferase
MISVVVPARNEGSVIARNLKAMTTGATSDELDVIVVCNGCCDDTAAIARGIGAPVRVIETDVASKTNALNLGDQAAYGFLRIYVDADVEIKIDAIRALVKRLEEGNVLAVAPAPRFDVTGCSWLVRAFFDVRSRLPSSREGIGGSGVYALSQVGRARFGRFPDLVADDGYVRTRFRLGERTTLLSVRSTVFAPRTIKDVVNIKTRAHYGSLELANLSPQLWRNKGESNHRSIIGLLRHIALWPKLVIYCSVMALARHRAKIRLRTNSFKWERDDASRAAR